MKAIPTSARLPEEIRRLLWDTDPDAYDPDRYPVHLIERVLELGTPAAVGWARDHFGDDRVREFIRNDGARRLSPRALNYWALILGIEDRKCLTKSCLANKGPLWRP